MLILRRRAAALLFAIAAATTAAGQGADPALDLLQQGQQAYAKRDFKTAAAKYQEFVQKFATHAQASRGKYGLALSLLQAGERDAAKVAPLLDAAADDAAFPDRASALQWAGTVTREWARRSPPAEAPARLEKAARRFADAAQAHAAAAKDWQDKGENPLADAVEAAARARVDHVETLASLGKTAEAAAAANALLKESWLKRSRSREAAWYAAGCALYAADDAVSAARALVHLAPFEQPLIGPHARFLLGRIHQLAGESSEASEHFDAIPAACERHIQAARQALQANAEIVRDNPVERARLEALVAAPPSFVADALYQGAILLYEQKKFGEALERLVKLGQQFAKHPRAEDARLLAGLALVQSARHAEAVQALQPLAAHPRLGAQARAGLARALARGADPANAQAYKQSLDQAAEHFKQAAGQIAQRPGEGADLLIEWADTLRRAGRIPDAVPVYRQLATTPRWEEAWVRIIACLQLQGKHAEAEEAFRLFDKDFPRSSFMAEALFHYAECAFAVAQAPGGDPKPRYEEAVKRYDRLIAKFPDLPQANLCRYRIALARHALGQYVEAAAALAAIPETERGGPLAGSTNILADALLRAGPAADQARDAVAAARRLQQLGLAIQALSAYIGGSPQSPEAPDAMVKLGFCHQQVAALTVNPPDRAQAAAAAVQVYEQLRAQFPNHPLRSVAEYERANSLALGGDTATALGKFPRFHAAPFADTPIAPVALLREGQLLRSLNRPAEAVNVLGECRAKYEEALKKDAARAAWVPLLRYHHGLALKEAKNNPEAAKVLQSVIQDFPQSEWVVAAKEVLKEIQP
jgi:TolA-binding protein